MPEFNEQVLVVADFKLTYPKLAGCIWSTVNEFYLRGTVGQRCGKIKKLKKSGMKPGVSDLTIAVPSGGYHGMYLEMKDKGKKYSDVTPDQRAHLALMTEMGYFATWAPGYEDAMKQIHSYMKNFIFQ